MVKPQEITLANRAAIHIRTLTLEEFPAVAQWIHGDTDVQQLQTMLQPVLALMESGAHPEPLVALASDHAQAFLRPLAAAYCTLLPGHVAALGGVRSVPGVEQFAIEMVQRFCRELCDAEYDQIQSITRPEDAETASIVSAANFTHVSTVQHMWRSDSRLPAMDARPDVGTLHARTIRWIDASTMAHQRLAQLIDDTFVETLDCPALNGLRSQQQVLDGFLEGQRLPDVLHWELLELSGSVVGCLLLKSHAPDTLELAYMGVLPHYRGWGLGHVLLARAIDRASELRAAQMVVSADAENAPAVHLYLRYGFVPAGRCHVWLYGQPAVQAPYPL